MALWTESAFDPKRKWRHRLRAGLDRPYGRVAAESAATEFDPDQSGAGPAPNTRASDEVPAWAQSICSIWGWCWPRSWASRSHSLTIRTGKARSKAEGGASQSKLPRKQPAMWGLMSAVGTKRTYQD